LARKPQSRCLIPLTEFWEPEGEKGSKTRTAFRIKDQPIFAWGGLWRQSAEWGPVYSGSMTDCNEAIRPVHDRMPVLLQPEEYDLWLNGPFEQLLEFQHRCFPAALIDMERTTELWVPKKPSVNGARQET
jgi:putative SOS response-associated peptidase YedK